MAGDKALSQVELRRLRNKILDLYLALREVKKFYNLDKCTLSDLVTLRWIDTKLDMKNPEIKHRVDSLIAKDKSFILAVHQMAIEPGEPTSLALALNCNLDLLSVAMGKISTCIEPYDYDTFADDLSKKLSDVTDSASYESISSKAMEQGVDQEIEMYDVHARRYLDNLLQHGKITYAKYKAQIEPIELIVKDLSITKDDLQSEIDVSLKEIKRQEKRSKIRSAFGKFLPKKRSDQPGDE